MSTEPRDLDELDVSVLKAVDNCIETGDFTPAIEAIQRLVDAGRSKRPATELLADICFRTELEYWPQIDDRGFHFRGTVTLRATGVCTESEICHAIKDALLERGHKDGYLDGELFDMVRDIAQASRSSELMEQLQRINRGEDRGFIA